MTIFLTIAFILSLLMILLAFAMDMSAVRARINGANGLPLLVALLVSAGGSLFVTLIAGLFEGWAFAGKIFLFSVVYHVAIATLTIWRLQSTATLVSHAERLKEMKIWGKKK